MTMLARPTDSARTVFRFLSRDVVRSLTVGLALACLTGCYKSNEQGGKSGSAPVKSTTSHGHDHPSEGPHHGSLIELGDEEYHAELLHDDEKHRVTVYLLDGKAAGKATTTESKIALNFVVDGKPQQFSLSAEREAGDATDKFSKFVAIDEALCTALDAKNSQGKLNVTIGGKQYTGALAADAHGHDHKH